LVNNKSKIENAQRAQPLQIAAGLASEYKNDKYLTFRRFPADCCRELQIRGGAPAIELVIKDMAGAKERVFRFDIK